MKKQVKVSLDKKIERRKAREDAIDIKAFESRANEPLISYEELVKSLKRSGKL